MNWLCFVLALIAFATGLYAAYLWLLSSRVPITRQWEAQSPIEDTDSFALAHLFGLKESVIKSSGLNAKAAWWTAIAVVAGSVGTLISIVKDLPIWKN